MCRRAHCIWPTIGALHLIMAPAALAQDRGNEDRGLAYARQHCSMCHAVEARQLRSPVMSVATFKAIANTPGMTALALTVWFQTPHPNMPNFVLQKEDRDDIIAYITSLRGD